MKNSCILILVKILLLTIYPFDIYQAFYALKDTFNLGFMNSK